MYRGSSGGASRRVHQALDEIVAEMWGRSTRGGRSPGVPTDVFVADDPPSLHIQFDLAGMDPDRIDVAIEGDHLVVRGERVPPRSGRRRYEQAEIDWGPVEHRVRLTLPVDPEGARASYERGLLWIALPICSPRTEPSAMVVRITVLR